MVQNRPFALVLPGLAVLLAGPHAFAAGNDSGLAYLKDASAFGRVCEAVRTEASARFEGDEVQRGQARAEFKRRRDDALVAVYTTDVPAAGFAFGEYDFDQRRLPVDLNRALRVVDGVELTIGAGSDDDYDFSLAPEVAQNVVKARSAGKLNLRLAFRLAATAELPDPCVRLGGGRSLKVRIDPLAFELVSLVSGAPKTVARVESPRYHDAVAELTPVSKPRVQISKTAQLQDVAMIKTLESSLLPCYKAGLAQNARLRGSLVLGIAIDKEGRVEWARPEIDAIGDQNLITCTTDHVKAQRFPRGQNHLSVPVFFQSGD